jgi:GT2 family glycosyltransferase
MKLTPQPLPPLTLFSIVIPSWNNLEFLKLCVGSVRAHSAFEHQIIVHVNDGSDGTLDWVRSQGIAYTHSAKNTGICLTVNQAAALAQHELIVYLNDDMYCCPQWDTRLLEKVKQIGHDGFMLSGTMIEPVDSGNRCVSVQDFGSDGQSFDEQGLLRTCQALAKADWYGATWPPTLVHRRWWHAVGGFSSEFSPGMSSDNDFSMKMWAAGCRVFLGVGDSMVYHFRCKSTGRIVKNDGRKQFMRKWGMTSSLFDRFYLRRGQVATQLGLTEPEESLGFRRKRFFSRIKAWLA